MISTLDGIEWLVGKMMGELQQDHNNFLIYGFVDNLIIFEGASKLPRLSCDVCVRRGLSPRGYKFDR